MRDLVNRVSEAHDHKKKDIKEIIETALAEMAKALDNNENMMLPSLGKVRIVRQGDVATGVPMTLKLRRSNPASSTEVADDKDSLAQDGEDS
ncbi:MAG: HU family DNA-binding protein [Cypionkella sp.]